MKRPSKFYPLDIDYGQEEAVGVAKLPTAGASKSKLAPQIQELIRTIFDIESMKKTMREFEASTQGEGGREGGREGEVKEGGVMEGRGRVVRHQLLSPD